MPEEVLNDQLVINNSNSPLPVGDSFLPTDYHSPSSHQIDNQTELQRNFAMMQRQMMNMQRFMDSHLPPTPSSASPKLGGLGFNNIGSPHVGSYPNHCPPPPFPFHGQPPANVIHFIQPALPDVQEWDGQQATFSDFKEKCLTFFRHQAQRYPSDFVKTCYVESRLTGPGRAWSINLSDADPIRHHLPTFLQQLADHFGESDTQGASRLSRDLLNLRHTTTVPEHCIRFNTLLKQLDLPDHPFFAEFFLATLKNEVRECFYNTPANLRPHTLLEIQSFLVHRENDLRILGKARHRQVPRSQQQPATQPGSTQAPKRTSRGPLTPEERQRRMDAGQCLVCASPDHLRDSCPRARPRPLHGLSVDFPTLPTPPSPVSGNAQPVTPA